MRFWVKTQLGRILFATGLYRRALRDQAVIVLFHRVNDSIQNDSLTCNRATFIAFCSFFRDYFHVISLDELIARLEGGLDIGGALVITFDDGYWDNCAVAAPILKSLDLPACFFIATGFTGTDRVPAWDAAKGIRSRWMTWDDVGDLHRQGFQLGSHTVNHVDLGKVGTEEAFREALGSKQHLEAELHMDIPDFAYPFGSPKHLTEANRREVLRAGFRSCLSVDGNLVRPKADVSRLGRIAISPWYRSPLHFGFEVVRKALASRRTSTRGG